MRKSFLVLLFLVVAAPLSFAQSTTDDQSPEFFVGYSNLQSEGIVGLEQQGTQNPIDRAFGDREGLNGVVGSVTGFFTPRFGITGDFSYHQDSREFTGANNADNTLATRRFNFHAGPVAKFRNESRVTPFVHALAGVSATRFDAETTTRTTTGGTTTTTRNEFDVNSTDFSLMVGGGLDVRVSDRFAVRAIQFDYNPVFFRDRSLASFSGTGVLSPNLEGQRADNVRISVGVVFK